MAAPLDFLEAIRRESDAFAVAAERGDLDAPVPPCPDWSLADLVRHLTEVQWFWNQIAAGPLLLPDDVGDEPDPEPDDRLVARFREGTAELVETLERAEPGTRLWSWAGGEQDIAWVRRRQAHEVVIHRWDAEAASNEPDLDLGPGPIEPALALDGVDEWAQWMADPEDLATVAPVSVRLVATDLSDERVLAVRPDGSFAHESTDGVDGTIEASASHLDLLLWRRISPQDVTILGDVVAVERFLGASDLT
jgi:uncharacterized protein (TIGR03083 family)